MFLKYSGGDAVPNFYEPSEVNMEMSSCIFKTGELSDEGNVF